jgi:uncharacterized protein YvpB/uncharacterized protein YukE
MTTIHLEPEMARQAARQLRQNAEDLQLSIDALGKAINRLNNSWISTRSLNFNLNAGDLNRKLILSSDDLMRLSLSLENEIDEWISTDEKGKMLFQLPLTNILFLGTVGGGAVSVSWLEGLLGSIGISGITLPSGWGAASIAGLIGSLPLWLQDWLKGIFGGSDPVVSPVVDEPVEVPHVTFGDLLKEDEATPSAQIPETSESVVSPVATTDQMTTMDTSNTTESYGYDVPVMSQGTLYGNAACFPTSIAMVTKYFNNLDANDPALSANDLISSMDKGDGTYGVGIGLDKLNDEIESMGYQTPNIQVNANMDDLKSALNSGPVIVNTGVKITNVDGVRGIGGAGNTNHAMVVTGISADGTQVKVNDPWSGKEIEYSAEDFSKIWNKGQNILVEVRPD